MNGPGDQLFAGPGLPENQDDRIAAGNLFNLIEHVIEPVTLTDNVLMVVLQLDFLLQIRPLGFKLVF